MQRARRRRVPAFGEWNYYYYSGELATPTVAASANEWYAAAPELEASSDVWFKYSPPPRKPPPSSSRKAWRPEKSYGGGKRATPARASDAVAPSSVARMPSGKAAASTARARVVRPVDADLYQVPPPEFDLDDHEPRRRHKERRKKKASRSTWMGCFGFNCVPAE
ncbi:hypothetical protein BAE44_0016620 [Dichanthelium oligosanthes]|uniref:Uncharacterized protein n=1 Tax=Dichanthelium oligosanthes TaxID=888268 RepID=A0A1E5VB87_9POAL|nr:hypothetical protein BAE44_0016620 [Dichanthelium oligosanthes]